MRDGFDLLSSASGLTRSEIRDIARDVQANRERLAACDGHDFVPLAGCQMFGPMPRKLICTRCQGQESSTAVAAYLRGRAHATGESFETLLNAVVAAPPMQSAAMAKPAGAA